MMKCIVVAGLLALISPAAAQAPAFSAEDMLTVAGLTGRPRIGRSAIATLRVESPRRKQARIMRSTSLARRA